MKKAVTKHDVFAALENAAWPVLLINGEAGIVRANEAATSLFGPALDVEVPPLSALWASENTSTAEKFLAQSQTSPAAATSLKFRVKGGSTESFLAAFCSIAHAKDLVLLQLYPEGKPTIAAGETS